MALPTASDNPFPSFLVTEGTVPSTPAAGKQRVYINSTSHRVKLVNSSGVESDLPGAELDYVQFTSAVNVTATVEASANTIVTGSAVAYDGNTVIMVEFVSPDNQGESVADGYLVLYLFDGSTSLGIIAFVMNQGASGHVIRTPVHGVRRLTPSNASHTYSIRGVVSGGTGVVTAGAGGSGNRVPGYIRITRA